MKEEIPIEHFHSDLNTFTLIKAILAGVSLYTPSGQRMADRMVRLCESQECFQLRCYHQATQKQTTATTSAQREKTT